MPSLPPPFPFLPLHTTPATISFPLALAREPRVWEAEGLGASLASAMADTGARGRGEEPEPVTPPPAQQQQEQAEETQAVDDRRLLRSQYLAVKGLISGRAVLLCETRTDSVILNFRSLFRLLAVFDFGDVCAAVFCVQMRRMTWRAWTLISSAPLSTRLRACTSMVSAIAFAGSWNRDFS